MELGGSWAPRGPAEEEEEGEDLDRNVASERGWILARIGQELLANWRTEEALGRGRRRRGRRRKIGLIGSLWPDLRASAQPQASAQIQLQTLLLLLLLFASSGFEAASGLGGSQSAEGDAREASANRPKGKWKLPCLGPKRERPSVALRPSGGFCRVFSLRVDKRATIQFGRPECNGPVLVAEAIDWRVGSGANVRATVRPSRVESSYSLRVAVCVCVRVARLATRVDRSAGRVCELCFVVLCRRRRRRRRRRQRLGFASGFRLSVINE